MDLIKDIENRKSIYWILFALITMVFLTTRLFRLDQVPFTAYGMHFDEMSAAYDAWCIQGWGVDRHLTRFPVYFMNTGPGQNALYIYLAAIMFKLFGFSLFTFRLIAVICASIAYICLFFFFLKLFGNGLYSLVPNALMSVMPVFLMSEHWGLESYLFLSCSIISFYLLVLSLEKRKSTFYLLSGISWGITFYSYGVSYIVIPLFFILAMVYLSCLKQMDIKMALCTAIPMLLLGVPLAAEQLVIQGIIEPFSIIGMDFLPMDRTGNRRFAPILTHAERIEKHILEDEEESRAYIEQLWAEAMVIFRSGDFSLKFSQSIEEYLMELQENFMPEDTDIGLIRAWLEDTDEYQVCSLMLYHEALNKEGEPKKYEIKEINRIMNESIKGWKHSDKKTHRFNKYGTQKFWYREDKVDDDGFIKCDSADLPFK